MINSDHFEDLMWQWAGLKDRQAQHETGWAFKSVAQTMIDSAKLGCMIPGTKPLGYVPVRKELIDIIKAIAHCGLTKQQRKVINIQYNNANRSRSNKEKASMLEISIHTYKRHLQDARDSLKRELST